MPQVIDNKKTLQNTEVLKSEMVKEKTPFQKEWEKAVPADKALDELLTYVRALWKK